MRAISLAGLCLVAIFTRDIGLLSLSALGGLALSRRKPVGLLSAIGAGGLIWAFSGPANAALLFLTAVNLAILSAQITVPSLQNWSDRLASERSRWMMGTWRDRARELRALIPRLPERRISIPAEAIVWMALVLPLAGLANGGDGSGFAVTTPGGEMTILKRGEYSVRGKEGPLTIRLDERGLCVVAAPCREKRCMHMGPIEAGSSRRIICAPGGVAIRALGRKMEVDAWTG